MRLSIALSGLCLGLLLVWLLLGFQQRTDLWPPSPAILQRLHLTPIVAAFKKLAAGVTRNSRYTVLANNMHRMRLMLETYPVTGGHYPPDVDTLYQDASRQNYWWGFRNPFDQGIIHHYREWMADYARYQQFSDKRSYRGKVLYEPIGTPPAGYRIYGCDENGALVRRENGDVYLLSNQLP
jgi:hypothetical protein